MSITVRTVLEPHGPATAILLDPAQVAELFGTRRVGPVLVEIAGRSARLRLASMGGRSMIGLSKASRAQLGVEIGGEVVATISVDDQERSVEIPPSLADALVADPAAGESFAALSFTRRKEMATLVSGAKKPETAQRRLEKILAELRG